ncbi:hypothetical protein M8J75_007702 [Diaphorina citri]|nr:hypothetical protein M8J75_007702 [Diaphorina citri]
MEGKASTDTRNSIPYKAKHIPIQGILCNTRQSIYRYKEFYAIQGKAYTDTRNFLCNTRQSIYRYEEFYTIHGKAYTDTRNSMQYKAKHIPIRGILYNTRQSIYRYEEFYAIQGKAYTDTRNSMQYKAMNIGTDTRNSMQYKAKHIPIQGILYNTRQSIYRYEEFYTIQGKAYTDARNSIPGKEYTFLVSLSQS